MPFFFCLFFAKEIGRGGWVGGGGSKCIRSERGRDGEKWKRKREEEGRGERENVSLYACRLAQYKTLQYQCNKRQRMGVWGKGQKKKKKKKKKKNTHTLLTMPCNESAALNTTIIHSHAIGRNVFFLNTFYGFFFFLH